MPKPKPKTIAEYINAAPKEAQKQRILFSFAAFKSHLNFMPTSPAMEPFKEELKKHVTGKDTIQFPHDKPLPKALIRRIAAFRVKQVREKDARWMY